MKGQVLWGLLIFFLGENAVATIRPLDESCVQYLQDQFSDNSSSGSCKNYSLFTYTDGTNGEFSHQISCTFSNRLTSYVFREDERIIVDVRGKSGRLGPQSGEIGDHYESFSNCEEAADFLQTIQGTSFEPFRRPASRDFQSFDSVLIVAPESICETEAGEELKKLLQGYHTENRKASAMLCLSPRDLASKNPSLIRRKILDALTNQSGILLIGTEIPTFEFFRATGWPASEAQHKYGHTDLPYGSLGSLFWDRPLSKRSSRLFNRIYHEAGFVHKVDRPTTFAFDLDQLIDEGASLTYRQDLWVGRWLAGREKLLEALRNFVDRRTHYRPSITQNLLYAQGGESFMYRPKDYFNAERGQKTAESWLARRSRENQVETLMTVDLAETLRFLDSETTFLILSEHGNPENVGNINFQSFEKIRSLPPLLHFDSCMVGAWGYADSAESSLIGASFHVNEPPLAIMASQGIKSLITYGIEDRYTPETYMMGWKSGQSLGSRQIETVNALLQNWSVNLSHDRFFDEFVMQVFHGVSIFGDGTVEN